MKFDLNKEGYIPYQRFLFLIKLDHKPRPLISKRFTYKHLAATHASDLQRYKGITVSEVYDTKKNDLPGRWQGNSRLILGNESKIIRKNMKPSKNKKNQPDALEQAAVLIDIIAGQQTLKTRHETALAEAIEKIKKQYAPLIDRAAANIAAGEKDLTRLMKKHRRFLFYPGADGSARRDLPGGHALIYSAVKKVRQIKGMLKRLELSGLTGCFRVKKTVDWDAVDDLSDDVLVQLGTERVVRENYAYEIRQTSCG